MAKQTFIEIRTQHPRSFLLLLDYEEKVLPSGQIEITAAEETKAFNSGEEMLEEYKKLRHSGRRVMFCSPEYQDKFIIERRPSMRVFG